MINPKYIHCEKCRQASESGQPNIQGEIISGDLIYMNRLSISLIMGGSDFYMLCLKHRNDSPVYEYSERKRLFDFEGRRFKAREIFASGQFIEEIKGGTQ